MKRKVKKFAEGGTNVRTRTDEEFAEDSKFGGYGRFMPKVKNYSMDDVKSGIGKLMGGKSTSRPSEDLAPYEAPSTMSGDQLPKSSSKDTLEEAPKGIASGFKSGESKFERNDNEVKMPSAKPKQKRKSSDIVTAKNLGSQDAGFNVKPKKGYGFEEDPSFKTLPGTPSVKEEKPQNLPGKTDAKKEYYRDFSGKIKEKTPDESSFKDFKDMFSRGAGALGRGISDYASTIKSPAQRRDEEKASKEKGFAKGGKVSSASSRGDGIAQRGKTKGRIC
jgi:hypothetical protein